MLFLLSSHPFNEKEGFDVADLKVEDVLLFGLGLCFRDQMLEVCPNCMRHKSADATAMQTLETIRYMVASGLGITILPCSAAGAERFTERLLNVRRFNGQAPSRVVGVALARRESFPRPEAITALRDALLACDMSCVEPVDG